MPIAAVYVLAHYLTYLLFEGQAISTSPRIRSARAGTCSAPPTAAIDFSLLSQNGTWYVAGRRSSSSATWRRSRSPTTARWSTLRPDAKLAVRSQYWMLSIMVGFTMLALWLLYQAGR